VADNYWDNSGGQPNLSRLPVEVREGMARPIPMRDDEVYAAVMIFKQSPGLNHPNGRCNVVAYRTTNNAVVPMDKGIQLDFSEFSGKFPLATVVIDVKGAEPFVANLLRAYAELGGDVQAAVKRAGIARTTAEHIAYFEDKVND